MTDKSFLEILSEKIESQLRTEMANSLHDSDSSVLKFDRNEKSTSEETVSPEVTPLWITQIPLGKIQFQTPKSQVFGKIYPVNTPKKRPAKPTPPRKKHVLTEQQEQAFAYFLNWKMGLALDFTQDELKRAFRQLAMKLHPDRNNGVTSHYMEMKKHYECLAQVFQSASSAKS